MEETAKLWDVICVGSGITALAFGAQMARQHPGRKVLILEKHSVPGGYATAFARRTPNNLRINGERYGPVLAWLRRTGLVGPEFTVSCMPPVDCA